MQTKSTHERRQHAVQVATVVTAFVFVGWIATLGVRFASYQTDVSTNGKPSNPTQLANVINGLPTDTSSTNSLEVSTTTTYTGNSGVTTYGQTVLPQQ